MSNNTRPENMKRIETPLSLFICMKKEQPERLFWVETDL